MDGIGHCCYLAPFVSKLATKEKVSAYVGCNFISYMIGLLGGTIVFGAIVNYVGAELEMPHFFYGILMAFGLTLLVIFIVYYWTWGQDIIARAKRIKEMEEGISEQPVIPSDKKDPILFRIFDILKPWPISWLDKKVHGGLGIMLDDVVSGFYALSILHVIIYFTN